MRVYTYIHAHTHTCTHMRVHTHMCTHSHTHIHTYTHMCTHTHTHLLHFLSRAFQLDLACWKYKHFLSFFTLSQYWSNAAAAAATAAKSHQSCPTLCDPIDGSPPGSPVPGILQARTGGLPLPSLFEAIEHVKKSKTLRTCNDLDFPGDSGGKASAYNARDLG